MKKFICLISMAIITQMAMYAVPPGITSGTVCNDIQYSTDVLAAVQYDLHSDVLSNPHFYDYGNNVQNFQVESSDLAFSVWSEIELSDSSSVFLFPVTIQSVLLGFLEVEWMPPYAE